MTTQEIISMLRDRRHVEKNVSMRQALFYNLYKQGLSGDDMSRLFEYTKKAVYYGIYTIRDRREIGDEQSVRSMNELAEHMLVVKREQKDAYTEEISVLLDDVELSKIDKAI